MWILKDTAELKKQNQIPALLAEGVVHSFPLAWENVAHWKLKERKKKNPTTVVLANPTKDPSWCFILRLQSVAPLTKILWLTFVLLQDVCGKHNSKVIMSLREVACPIFFGLIYIQKKQQNPSSYLSTISSTLRIVANRNSKLSK